MEKEKLTEQYYKVIKPKLTKKLGALTHREQEVSKLTTKEMLIILEGIKNGNNK